MKKTIRKSLSILMIFAMMFAFSSCGEKKAAEEAAAAVFEALKANDLETVKQYTSDGFLPDTEIRDENAKKLLGLILSKTSYEILSSEKNEDGSCTVKVNFTAADTSVVAENMMKQIFKIAFDSAFPDANGHILTPEELEEKLFLTFYNIVSEELNKDEIKTITEEITLTVKTEDGKQILSSDVSLTDIMFRGIGTAIEKIDQAIEGFKE